MLWHLLITPLVALLDALYAALPVWNIDLGTSWLHYGLYWLAPFDKLMPIHDGFLPIMLISASVFAALNAVKWFKFLLSLVPTISASG